MKPIYALALFLAGALAYAQEPLLTNRLTELREAPDFNGKVLQTLPEKSAVQLIERRGAWSQVKAGATTGWVRMMHLRGGVVITEAQPSSGGSVAAGFTRIFGGNQTEARTRNATLGVRGISAEQLKTASPNAQELAKMVANRTDKPAAEKFAKEAPVNKTDVAELSTNERGRK